MAGPSRSPSVLIPYYAATAHALSDHYGVGGGTRGRTFTGNPVWKDAVFFVSPRDHTNWFTGATSTRRLAVLLAQRRWRVAGCSR